MLHHLTAEMLLGQMSYQQRADTYNCIMDRSWNGEKQVHHLHQKLFPGMHVITVSSAQIMHCSSCLNIENTLATVCVCMRERVLF